MTTPPLAKKKRSGGPRTLAGKAMVSQNAIKTGTYSAALILPHENQSEYQELERRFMEEYQPVGITEVALVNNLVRCLWKKARLERIEHSHLIALISQPMKAEEYFRAGYQRERDRRVDWILEHIWDYEEEDEILLRATLHLANRSAEDAETFQKLFTAIKQFAPAPLCEEMISEYEEAGRQKATARIRVFTQERGGDCKLTPNERLTEEHFRFRIEGLIEERKLILSIYHDKPELEKLKPIIFDHRQLVFMERPGVSRPREDINRELHRTLKEFRLQREWRLENQPIDITAS